MSMILWSIDTGQILLLKQWVMSRCVSLEIIQILLINTNQIFPSLGLEVIDLEKMDRQQPTSKISVNQYSELNLRWHKNDSESTESVRFESWNDSSSVIHQLQGIWSQHLLKQSLLTLHQYWTSHHLINHLSFRSGFRAWCFLNRKWGRRLGLVVWTTTTRLSEPALDL